MKPNFLQETNNAVLCMLIEQSVIGKTKSGKDIRGDTTLGDKFDAQDHRDAADAHEKKGQEMDDKGFPGVADHHYKLSKVHKQNAEFHDKHHGGKFTSYQDKGEKPKKSDHVGQAPTVDVNAHKKHDWRQWSSEDHKDLAKKYLASAKKNSSDPHYRHMVVHQKKIAAFHKNAADHKDWFATLSKEQQDQYKKLHPKSKLV